MVSMVNFTRYMYNYHKSNLGKLINYSVGCVHKNKLAVWAYIFVNFGRDDSLHTSKLPKNSF